MGREMKKVLFVLFVCLFNFNVNAKTLILYYSKTGHTEIVANKIHDITGYDIIKVSTTDPAYYSDDYGVMTEQVKQERKMNRVPQIADIPNIDEYDTLIFGTPVWYGGPSRPALAFFQKSNLIGKKIGVFVTHGGSGMEHAVTDLVTKAPASDYVEPLSLYGREVENADNIIRNWLLRWKLWNDK